MYQEQMSRTVKNSSFLSAVLQTRAVCFIRTVAVVIQLLSGGNTIRSFIYEVSCNGCELTYVGETNRAFGTRLEEHRRKAEKKMGNQNFTRSKRKESKSQNNNSAISDHAARANHIIGWENSKHFFRKRLRERPGGYASQFGLKDGGG